PELARDREAAEVIYFEALCIKLLRDNTDLGYLADGFGWELLFDGYCFEYVSGGEYTLSWDRFKKHNNYYYIHSWEYHMEASAAVDGLLQRLYYLGDWGDEGGYYSATQLNQGNLDRMRKVVNSGGTGFDFDKVYEYGEGIYSELKNPELTEARAEEIYEETNLVYEIIWGFIRGNNIKPEDFAVKKFAEEKLGYDESKATNKKLSLANVGGNILGIQEMMGAFDGDRFLVIQEMMGAFDSGGSRPKVTKAYGWTE
ncbi:MAG: hypothetical protein FWE86_02550, partial [Oscillospiraceae bacterium]|nr:hypothetical protein [Oscillospiraceae bacterium]